MYEFMRALRWTLTVTAGVVGFVILVFWLALFGNKAQARVVWSPELGAWTQDYRGGAAGRRAEGKIRGTITKAHEMSDETRSKIAMCEQIAAGAQARLHDVKMEFRWLSPEQMILQVWKPLKEHGQYPLQAFFIRDDGESAEERATVESNVMMGWRAQDQMMTEGTPIDPQRIRTACMEQELHNSLVPGLGRPAHAGLKLVASSEGLRVESCRGEAAQAMMLWRLEYEYGKGRDEAQRLMGASYSDPPDETQFTRWHAWVRDWGNLAVKPRFLDYAQGRCMNRNL